MNSCYERWLEKETVWIKEQRKGEMKRVGVCCLILVLLLPLISLVSGLLSGVPDFWKGVPGSLLVGILICLVIWIAVSLSSPVKRYGRNIGKQMENLSQTERENMARQMLGEEPDMEVHEVIWRGVMEGNNRACITRDYLTFSWSRGAFQVVQLWKTERIELDVRDSSYQVRSGGTSVRIKDESYPMFFYYRGNHNEQCDTSYIFEKRQWREEVLQAIRAVSKDSRF